MAKAGEGVCEFVIVRRLTAANAPHPDPLPVNGERESSEKSPNKKAGVTAGFRNC